MGVGAKVGLTRLGLIFSVVVAMSLLALPSAASADHHFCPPGSGTGQCEEHDGVATDAETGLVYIADNHEGTDRIQVFDEDGGYLRTIGAGLLNRPRGVTVDNDPASPTQGDVFVIDGRNQPRVLRFTPTGELRLGFGWGVANGSKKLQTCGPEGTPPTVSCLAGIEGKGECQLTGNSQIAAGPGGRLFVADSAFFEITEFGADESKGFNNRVMKFALDGASCEEAPVFPEASKKRLNAIAVDSEGGVYLAVAREGTEIRKLAPDGSLQCSFDKGSNTVSELATDPATDRLYAARSENQVRGSGFYWTVAIFEPGCSGEAVDIVSRFGYGQIEETVRGLAVLPGALVPARAGEAVLSEGFSNPPYDAFHLEAPPLGPIIAPGSVIADPISNTKATLGAEINAEGKETEVGIEYIEKATCEANEAGPGKCFDGAQASEAIVLPEEGFDLQGVETQFGCADPLSEEGHLGENAYEAGECLQPDTAYRFRVAASNADGEGNSPLDGGTFVTRPWVEFGPAWASGVGTGSARLSATVNPLGVPVDARFEVVDQASFEASGFAEAFEVPASSEDPLDFGAGEAPTVRTAGLGGLAPGTTYRYRLVADHPLAGPVDDGLEHSFSTFAAPGQLDCPANDPFRTGAGALLPDCRGYEMVSPLDKEQGDIIVLNAQLSITPAVLEQASLDGSRLAYGSVKPFGDAPSAPWTSQYIAQRHERGTEGEGWQSHGISSPIDRLLFDVPQFETELKALSPDLCSAWVRSISEPTLAEGAQAGYPNLYRRSDEECGGPSYEALSTAPWQNLAPGSGEALKLELQGVSADGGRAIFLSPDSFVGTGAPDRNAKDIQLYVWAGGPLPVFACVLPGGEALQGPCSGGRGTGSLSNLGMGRFTNVQGALSADGERVFWTASLGDGKLYLRENPDQPQSALAHGAATGAGNLAAGSNKVTSLIAAAGTGALVKGSSELTGLKTTKGSFLVGQPIAGLGIPAATTVLACSPSCDAGATALTLSKAASINNPTVEASSQGPMPFAVGQEITAAGGAIPSGTTIVAVAPGSLTLSANATKAATGAALTATSDCTEAPKACTIAVSAGGEALSGTEKSMFRAAALDGSKAVFTTNPAGPGEDLYLAHIGTAAGRPVLSGTDSIAGEVVGMMGASEDASHVYFASEEAIGAAAPNSEGDEAEAGEPNLYLYREGDYAFIGTLSAQEAGELISAIAQEPAYNLSRVAADGDVAFVSSAPLTGYDNADTASGEAVTEVFLYDAGTGELSCASCNPSGARPVGRQNEDKVIFDGPSWISAWFEGHQTSLYASRELSADGSRLFFNSTDSLLARDTNGRADVYQWEAPGTGSCDTASSSYSARNEGCIELISSGQSAQDSLFVEASPSGDDVFFTTLSNLVAADFDLVDVYDARVGGGFPPPPPLPAGCEGEACQSPPEAPDDPTPASAAYEGAGNVSEAPPVTKPRACAKGKVRRKGRCVAKHTKQKQRAKRHKRRQGR